MMFIPLQVRSAYSLLDSTVSIEELVSSAVEKGYQAIALTDHNVMYGAVSFYLACEKHGIKPIIGLTADVLSDDESTAHPLVLLARNENGYQNLMKISSALQTKAKRGLPFRWLKGYSDDLIAITPGEGGVIESALHEGRMSDAEAIIRRYQTVFSDGRFYLSLFTSTEQVGAIKQIANKCRVPLVAGGLVKYNEATDQAFYQAIVCLRENTIVEESVFGEEADYHLKPAIEMTQLFASEAEALANCEQIVAQCQLRMQFQQKLLPHYPVPDGVNVSDYLRAVCLKGFQLRYPQPTQTHIDRLDFELSVIANMQFDHYFLIVWDFMRYARQQKIMTGPGRGSAAGSIVSYVLGITNVDPIAFDLLFERFLNPERISMPDIDIDFPDNRRDEMIQYVANKYGEMHVAQIITFGTFGPKSAVRDAGRVYGLAQTELDFLAKQIPSTLGTKLAPVLEKSGPLKQLAAESPLYKRVFETALKWEGLPRHTSTHAAGVVMSTKPLTASVPVQEGHDGVLLTQFPMEQLEQIGLLKMDFLGLRNLNLLEKVLREINRTSRREITLADIPFDDEKTFKMISRGDTLGVFQLESDGLRNVLRKLKPTQFEDIIAVTALFRPGPMDNIQSFVDRKHGREAITYPHIDLKPILEKTYGVIVYQEQIMQIAAVMAGFSLGDADLLRKAVSKKKKDVLDEERQHFVGGAISKGYTEIVADSVYDLIVKFANYGFNRSHSVAYGTIAYQLAYLKANYPRHFLAEVMTGIVGNNDKIAHFIQELRSQGVDILPPLLNKSSFGFSAEGDNAIRFGLASVKQVNGALIREIFRERKIELFKSFFDFFTRIPIKMIPQKVIEDMIYAGCFDEFGQHRAALLASIDIAYEHASLVNPDGQGPGMLDADFFLQPKYAVSMPMDEVEKLQQEKQAIGTYISAHPVSTYKELFKTIGVMPLANFQAGDTVICGAYIHKNKVIRTKKGEQMAFLRIGDESDEIEAVVFPKVYQKVSELIASGNVCVFEGKIEEKNRQRQLMVDFVYDEEKALATLKDFVYLNIPVHLHDGALLTKIKRLLNNYRGHTKVYMHYEKDHKLFLLHRKDWVNASEAFYQVVQELLGEENIKSSRG